MRVAVVTRTTERRGGIETYLEMVLGALARRGHALALFCEEPDSGHTPTIELPAEITLLTPGPEGASPVASLRAWQPEVVFSQGLADPALETACFAVAPSVFFAHTYHGTCISGSKMFRRPEMTPCHRRFGWPCLAHYLPRGCGGMSPVTMVQQFRVQAERLAAVRRCSWVVTLSDYMRDEYVAHGVAAGRITCLPHWSSAQFTGPVDARRRSGNLRLSFIGRLEREKGGLLAIAALAEVASRLSRPVHLSVAGDGPQRERWQRAAASVCLAHPDVSVEFLGKVDSKARLQLLAETDVLVVPSVWPEPFGLVGLEAAAAGVPAAAFRVGGIPEWLEDGATGYLADANPPSASTLATAIVACAESDEILHRLQSTLRARSARGGEARHLDELERALQQAIAIPV
jgi:glycosyltransferase involved in cell wall biosynthesis